MGAVPSARAFLLTDWVTVRGNTSTVGGATQDDTQWLDLSGFTDATFWIEIADLTSPGSVLLNLESSPTLDESTFTPVVAPISLSPSTTPVVVKTVSAVATFPLARVLRWRISTTGSGAWSVTMRIRVVANRTRYFVPTQISGCSLWLRSDLGVSLSGSTVTAWADQSGLGNGATRSSGGPTYNTSGGVNGLPRVTVASGQYMTGALLPNVSNHTLFAVLGYASPLNNYAAFAGTDSSFTVNSGFAQFTETPTGIIARTKAGAPFFSAVTTDTSSLGSLGIYSTAADATAVDLYVNGTSKASTSTGASLVASTNYVLFALNAPAPSYSFVGDAYEFILFNSVLSAANRRRVHRYLGARYGITVP